MIRENIDSSIVKSHRYATVLLKIFTDMCISGKSTYKIVTCIVKKKCCDLPSID